MHDDIDRFGSRYRWASVFFLETVDSQWLPLITAAETPDKIWKALQDKFARENTVSFNSQSASLLNLRATSISDLSATITKFDTEWTRLTRRCSVAKASPRHRTPRILRAPPNRPRYSRHQLRYGACPAARGFLVLQHPSRQAGRPNSEDNEAEDLDAGPVGSLNLDLGV